MVRGRPRTRINTNNRETVPRRSRTRANADNDREPVLPTVDAQTVANHLQTLLQGLERVARIAMEVERRRPREVDPFFELYLSFNSLHPPTFDGTGDFEAAENWIANIKDRFQILRAPEENRVELATQLFEKHSRFWWQETKRQSTGPVIWEEFERLFEGRYMDIRSRELLRQKFTSLKQGNGPVTEYNSKFENLMRYAPDIVQDEFRLKQQYLSGLNPRLAQLIDLPSIDKLADLMSRASTAESYENRISQNNGPRNVRLKIDENPTPFQQRSDYHPNNGVKCDHCNKNHATSQCSVFNGLCHRCFKSGHFAKDCPRNAVIGKAIQNEGLNRGYVRPQTSTVNATTRAPFIGKSSGYNNRNGNRSNNRVGVHVHQCTCDGANVMKEVEEMHGEEEMAT